MQPRAHIRRRIEHGLYTGAYESLSLRVDSLFSVRIRDEFNRHHDLHVVERPPFDRKEERAIASWWFSSGGPAAPPGGPILGDAKRWECYDQPPLDSRGATRTRRRICHRLRRAALACHRARPATLVLDASRAADGIMEVRERIPATAGSFTIVYPKWIPASTARPARLTISLRCASRPMARRWTGRRDPNDLYAFHVDVRPARKRSMHSSTC